MRGDKEVSTVISAEDIKEEGPHGNSNTAISGEPGTGEFGSGEPGRV